MQLHQFVAEKSYFRTTLLAPLQKKNENRIVADVEFVLEQQRPDKIYWFDAQDRGKHGENFISMIYKESELRKDKEIHFLLTNDGAKTWQAFFPEAWQARQPVYFLAPEGFLIR